MQHRLTLSLLSMNHVDCWTAGLPESQLDSSGSPCSGLLTKATAQLLLHSGLVCCYTELMGVKRTAACCTAACSWASCQSSGPLYCQDCRDSEGDMTAGEYIFCSHRKAHKQPLCT